MKSYKNLFPKISSYKNLYKAYRKARKGKSSTPYVLEFEKNLKENILQLKRELESFGYKPFPLIKFIVRDPKTRVIRKSNFRDRVIHHAIVNVLEPIYEKVFIYDSYANRINKGTLEALNRFDKFKRKISKNGEIVKFTFNNNMVKGYVLKADIKHFFDSIDQNILINILKCKIKDKRVLWLINQILRNFDKEIGMPLGNMTSQFFANVYLNELDYFIKHNLKARYYIRYVDDFVILHKNKEVLLEFKNKIEKYLINLKLELHPDKSKIFPIYKGINFLGYRIFFYYRLLRKRNINSFKNKLIKLEYYYKSNFITHKKAIGSLEGWLAYAIWANTYRLRKHMVSDFNKRFSTFCTS